MQLQGTLNGGPVNMDDPRNLAQTLTEFLRSEMRRHVPVINITSMGEEHRDPADETGANLPDAPSPPP